MTQSQEKKCCEKCLHVCNVDECMRNPFCDKPSCRCHTPQETQESWREELPETFFEAYQHANSDLMIPFIAKTRRDAAREERESIRLVLLAMADKGEIEELRRAVEIFFSEPPTGVSRSHLNNDEV
jgi:hypothetical protein